MLNQLDENIEELNLILLRAFDIEKNDEPHLYLLEKDYKKKAEKI